MKQTQITKFSNNWNKKLSCEFFTTLRLRNDKKYKPGSLHKILLLEKGVWRNYGFAKVVEVRILMLSQLNNFITGIDTGYNVENAKKIFQKMYKKSVPDINHAEFSFILFQKEKIKPIQKTIFE